MFSTRLSQLLLLVLTFAYVVNSMALVNENLALKKPRQIDDDIISIPTDIIPVDPPADDTPSTTETSEPTTTEPEPETSTTTEETSEPTEFTTTTTTTDPPLEETSTTTTSTTSTTPEPTVTEPLENTTTFTTEAPASTGNSDDDETVVEEEEPTTTQEPVTSTFYETFTRTNSDGSLVTTTSQSVTTTIPGLNDDDDGNGGGGLSPATRNIVIGVVVGVGGAILIGALGIVAWRIRSRKKLAEENDSLMEYNAGYATVDKTEPSVPGSSPTTAPTGSVRSPFQSTLDNYHQPTQPINQSSNF